MTDLAYATSAPRALWRATLTPQQATVTELVSQGLTNREIGERMFVSEETAKYHVSAALLASGARNRLMLARWWWEAVESRAS